MKTTTHYCLLLFFLLQCCTPKDNIQPSVDAELKPYYDLFVNEALSRSYSRNFLNNYESIRLGSVTLPAVGETDYQTKTIVIDSVYWRKNKNYEFMKEQIVFHELGHLFLQRDHNLSFLPNDEFKSIMTTSEKNTKPNFLFFRGLRRKHYIDELFDYSSQVIPEWSKADFDPFPLSTSNRQLLASQAFKKSSTMEDFLKKYTSNVAFQFTENNSLLNVKTQNETSFTILDDMMMGIAGISQDKIDQFKKSTNAEIEVRYRVKSGTILNAFFNPNDPLVLDYFGVNQSSDGSLSLKVSLFFTYKIYESQNYVNTDFNVLRFVRQGSYFAYYLNNKLVHYSDIYNPKNYAINRTFFLTVDPNSEVDLDYFRLYTRP